jgi:hypothetical protein
VKNTYSQDLFLHFDSASPLVAAIDCAQRNGGKRVTLEKLRQSTIAALATVPILLTEHLAPTRRLTYARH